MSRTFQPKRMPIEGEADHETWQRLALSMIGLVLVFVLAAWVLLWGMA